MPAFITFGRILFAVLFIYTGATKFRDLSRRRIIANKVTIPALVTPYTTQLERLAGMELKQMLAQSPLRHWNWSAVCSSR